MVERRIPVTIENLADKHNLILMDINITQEEVNADYARSVDAGNAFMEKALPGYGNKNYIPPAFELSEIQKEVVEGIVNHDVALLLVRPEMYHHHGAFHGFLDRNGFNIIYSGDRTVDYVQYSQICRGTFSIDDAKHSFPTRTAVYTNSPTKLIIFTDPKRRYSLKGITLADGFVNEFKGAAGVYQPGTLRGDVVFNEALRLGFDKLDDSVLALATDPFHTCRYLTQLPGTHPHSHLPKDRSLMFYNSVSVHIPNGKEIVTDLAILNTISQLNEISNQLNG